MKNIGLIKGMRDWMRVICGIFLKKKLWWRLACFCLTTEVLCIYAHILHLRDNAGKVSPCLQPVEDSGLPPPLCVDVVQYPAGNCYKSGKLSWLLNFLLMEEETIIVYRIRV